MEKAFDIVTIGTVAYDMILRTVDESVFTRDTTLLESVGVSSGGAAMTQAVVAQRLGCKTSVVGKVGKDEFSRYLLRVLREAGVDCTHLAVSEAATMSLTFALVKEDGSRHFLGLAGSNNQTLCLEDFDLSIVRQAKIVSYGSFFFLQGLDGGGVTKILREAKSAGALTVADAASDSFHQGRELVFRNLPLLDYFIPSYVEAEYLTGTQNVAEMAQILLAGGCGNVLIKVGADGCYVANSRMAQLVPGFCQEHICDTTGAGDNFVGGFMAGLIQGRDLLEAVRYANAVASVSVTGMGAVSALRDRTQVDALLGSEQTYINEKK